MESAPGNSHPEEYVLLVVTRCICIVFCCMTCMQAGLFQEASKAASKVEGHEKAVTLLLVANAYEQDDLVGESAINVPCTCI